MLWYVLGIQSRSPSSPMTLLTAVLLINPSSFPNNPVLLPTLLICFQFRCHIMLASSVLPLVKDHIFSVFHWYHSYAVCVSPIASHWMTFWPKAFFRNDSYQTPYIENSWFFTVKKNNYFVQEVDFTDVERKMKISIQHIIQGIYQQEFIQSKI